MGLFLLLGAGIIAPDARERLTGIARRIEGTPGEANTRRGPWLEAACRAHRLVVAGLGSTLFLGGWVLPGLSPTAQDARPALEVAGAAWLLVKTWGLVALLAWARTLLAQRTLAERSRRTALALAPLSAAVLVATAAWTWWSPVGPAQLLVSGTLVAASALAITALAHRVRQGLDASHADGHLSPFL